MAAPQANAPMINLIAAQRVEAVHQLLPVLRDQPSRHLRIRWAAIDVALTLIWRDRDRAASYRIPTAFVKFVQLSYDEMSGPPERIEDVPAGPHAPGRRVQGLTKHKAVIQLL